MRRSNKYIWSNLKTISLELTTIAIFIVVATQHFLGVSWYVALGYTPFIMLAMLATLVVMVEALWLMVMTVEKISRLLGLHRSPLA